VGVHFLRKRKSSLLIGVARTPRSSQVRSPRLSDSSARS
jgi:hypothetical protein